MSACPDAPSWGEGTEAALRRRLDDLAKPPGALGRIEDLAVQLALIQGRPDPRADRVVLLIFAGDHGLTAEGVSSYPASVTAAMVGTLLAGRATASAFARSVGVEVRIVDAGVDADLPAHPDLRVGKVRRGTRNAAREPAMTVQEVQTALSLGAREASAAIAEGAEILVLGEMGIGNTASAALLMHRLAPAPLQDCVGLGAGHTSEGLAHKHAALERAAARSEVTEPLAVLQQFGGFEITAMTGALIAAAARRTPVVVDGFIVTAAALAAVRLQPSTRTACIFAHCSQEAGHRRMLTALDAEPLLDLGLRLGEGTGGVLAVPLLRAAVALLNEVATLEDVVSGRV